MMRWFITCLCLALAPTLYAQITVTNVSVADAFVRSLDPTHNYGGAGALSVSGSIATNVLGQQEGLLDSFMRFDMSGAVSNFNTSFGVGRWVTVGATLVLFEQGQPNNTIFNRGVGPFEVRWIADNSWIEGTGNPNNPTTDGIVWNDEPSALNSNLDESLGTFVNGGTDGVVNATLEIPSGFASQLSTNGLVSFYMTATTNSAVGFTFHSHNFVTPAEWPYLQITAAPIPQITSIGIIGGIVRISFTTGSNLSYIAQYNNSMAAGGWNTLTNVIGNGDTMTIADSNVTTVRQRFYRVGLIVGPQN
ncbi:MAG TPA: hypothetical protein VMV72_01370 [Verrucomicrobiae bacterium]|nr:hypothetical protein [Verrucomicrobiae bacterium]